MGHVGYIGQFSAGSDGPRRVFVKKWNICKFGGQFWRLVLLSHGLRPCPIMMPPCYWCVVPSPSQSIIRTVYV